MRLCLFLVFLVFLFVPPDSVVAQTKSREPSQMGFRFMPAGWPFVHQLVMDCEKLNTQMEQLGVACIIHKGDLRLHLNKNFYELEQTTQRKLWELIELYALAGATDFTFVDESGPTTWTQLCTVKPISGGRKPRCYDWEEKTS